MVIRVLAILGLLVSTSLTSACVPVALTAGAATGIAASKEGGISSELTDARIQATINDAWFRYDVNMFSKLHLTVEQGNVLITGIVQNPEDRVEAVRLAWSAEGVKQVINEIQIADSDGITGYLRDTWIGTQLRAKMTASRDISALNYSIDVVKGTVYLMGIARSQAELNEVVDIARNIDYVQNVVSYVRVDVEQTPVIKDAVNNAGQLQSNTQTTTTTTTTTSQIPQTNMVSQSYNSGQQEVIGVQDLPPKPAYDGTSSVGMQPIVEDPAF